ncbi:hypothetical protein NP493_767g00011 [Ridgeia piscesae]|uniref:VWFA domain-containing protein n=1 Tax=Ridgeia piscesae TaxID=27915 RepID=A0AAD9KQC9_RIDPI|nr:hypothetical protein NP493_767g00011 [Ridgeia piscesae]
MPVRVADPYRNSVWSPCTEDCGWGTRSRDNEFNNETQTINCHTLACPAVKGECRGDIVFILDSSGSIGDFNWHIAKQFAIDVMRGLKVGANQSHIGSIIYSPEVEVVFNLTQFDEVADIEDNMWSMPYISGTTNTADGLEALTVMVKDHGRGDAQPIAILLTDGISNVDANLAVPNAEYAKDNNIVLFVVGEYCECDGWYCECDGWYCECDGWYCECGGWYCECGGWYCECDGWNCECDGWYCECGGWYCECGGWYCECDGWYCECGGWYCECDGWYCECDGWYCECDGWYCECGGWYCECDGWYCECDGWYCECAAGTVSVTVGTVSVTVGSVSVTAGTVSVTVGTVSVTVGTVSVAAGTVSGGWYCECEVVL